VQTQNVGGKLSGQRNLQMTDDINSKIISTILFWTYFLTGLLTEGFILWLFPNTGLGGLICWPTALFLSLVFAFGLLKIHKKFKSRRVTVVSFVSFLFIQLFLQLLITPQEYGGEPIEQVSKAITTYKRFDKIDFSDFAKLDQFERVAYIYKNEKLLPDSYLILSIDSLNDEHLLPGDTNFYTKSKTYIIENRDGERNWNKEELALIETDSSTIIIERIENGDSLVYKATNDILRGGVGTTTDNVSIFCTKDDLKLTTGMQKMFYELLSFTKKRGE
jgi:hypothetical protein